MTVDTRAAIRTRYIGPTNFRGSRIAVSDGGGFGWGPRRLVVGWDYALNPVENHAAAAEAWLAKFIEGSSLAGPGLGFAHEYFWTWEHAS